jgi:hypothetical protein
VITTSFPEAERPRAIGVWVGVAGVGAVLGLFGTGILLEFFDWNSFFGLNVALAVLAIAGVAVVVVAAQIFLSADDGGGLDLAFHVAPISLVNGFAMGFLIAFVTVALTSIRISRINIIAAIRDLPNEGGRRLKRRWVVASTLAAAVFGALSVQAITGNQGVGSYLFPALAVLALCPLLVRLAPRRWVYSGASLAVLG